MEYLVSFFGWIMGWCHALVPNYWFDIVLFTVVTKVLQFPLTLWCHVNSLKMVSLMPKTNRLKIQYYGDTDKIGEETAALFKREHYHPMLSLVPLALQIVILMGFVKVIYTIAAVEEGSLIGRIPVRDGGVAWVMPIIAAGAACVLGWCQNRINPLQREQTKVQQMVTNGVSIGISLFLGVYVAMGVGLYWAVSNVLSILTQLWCNVTVRPSSKINYDDLEKSKAEIASLENGVEVARSKSDRAREKRDYKRFFSVANKHLVFYAEGGGYYKYFKTVIEWLLQNSNVVIHYVTNDPQDGIFKIAENERRLRPYYIGQMRTITLFMKMDADIVVMTTPDLGTYQLKRSYVKRDVEYCYIGHGTSSISLTFRKGAFDYFDTVFVNGQYHIDEHRATERVYGLKPKTLVPAGYPYLDTLVRMNPGKSYGEETGKELILIAPSHQPGNLLESCLREMVESLCREGRVVVVRPHPQYIRRFPAKVRLIVESFKEQLGEGLRFELDFSVNTSVLSADLLITDWSAIAFEYAIVTKRPVVFVNTPPKITNREWDRIGIPPNDFTYRKVLGVTVDVDKIATIGEVAEDVIVRKGEFADRIVSQLNKDFCNIGCAGEAVGKYILDTLIKKQEEKKNDGRIC